MARSLPRPLLHAAGGAGDHVAARHRAVRRRRGGRRSSSGCRRRRRRRRRAGVGRAGARRRAGSDRRRRRVAAVSARASRGGRTPCRPRTPSSASTGSSPRCRPGPLRERLQQLSGRLDDGIDESWRIARRGHEIVGAIGTDRHRVGASASSPSCAGRSARGTPTPSQAETIEALRGPAGLGRAARRRSPTAAATGCACSTPASTSWSPAPSRSASAPATPTCSATTSTASYRAGERCASPWRRPTGPTRRATGGRAATPDVRRDRPTHAAPSRRPSIEPAALEPRRRHRHGAVAGHRAGSASSCSATSSARPRSPTPTRSATRRRTSSTSCCSAACCRPRWCRCSRRSLERDDEESTNVVITVALVALAALTAVAVVAAPLIFGLYTLDPARRRRRRAVPRRSARC